MYFNKVKKILIMIPVILIFFASFLSMFISRLYNKESILEFLIDKSKFENASGFAHIRGLKVGTTCVKKCSFCILNQCENWPSFYFVH